MAAPKGNKFWQIRAKHGRSKLFASPKLLWEAAVEYFEWCDKNPWKEDDWVGKDAISVTRKTQRPYTLMGLCIYLGVNTKYFNDFKDGLKGKKDKKSKDFSEIVTRIEETIRTLKFEGAVVGAFNANIIARDLGLTEKIDATNKNTNVNYNADVSPEEAKKIAKDLEGEY